MKLIMPILFFIQWPFVLLMAQKLQLNANAGYYTGSKLPVSHGRFLLDGGPSYGTTVGYTVRFRKKRKDLCFELQYAHMASVMHFEPYNTSLKMNMGNTIIHSVLGGMTKKIGTGVVQPYGTALAGFTIFNPEMYPNLKRTTFTLSFVAGLRIAITPALGFCLQAQALLPIMYDKVYTGWEPGVGVETNPVPVGVMLSGYFSGGLYFNLIKSMGPMAPINQLN